MACRWALIEIFQRPGASPQTQQGYLTFLDAIGDLVADYCRNSLFRDFRLRAGDWTRLAQFIRRAHGSLDLKRNGLRHRQRRPITAGMRPRDRACLAAGEAMPGGRHERSRDFPPPRKRRAAIGAIVHRRGECG